METYTKIILFIAFAFGFVIVIGSIVDENNTVNKVEKNKIEAQKIIDFRNADYSCDKILKVYFKFETIKYNSITNVKWFNEARDKLIDNECISNKELNNSEFINICIDGKTIGCAISKLEHPELYENFNFEQSIRKHFPEIQEIKN